MPASHECVLQAANTALGRIPRPAPASPIASTCDVQVCVRARGAMAKAAHVRVNCGVCSLQCNHSLPHAWARSLAYGPSARQPEKESVNQRHDCAGSPLAWQQLVGPDH